MFSGGLTGRRPKRGPVRGHPEPAGRSEAPPITRNDRVASGRQGRPPAGTPGQAARRLERKRRCANDRSRSHSASRSHTTPEPAAVLNGIPGGTIVRQVTWLALPVLIEQTLFYLVGFSDTLLTGRFLSVEDLAAVTVSSYLLWVLGSVLMVASAGGTALVSRLIGSGDRAGASRLAQQAIALGLAVGLGCLAVGLPVAPAIVRGLGLDGASAAGAVVYLRIVLLATPLLACQVVGVACLRGAGDTRAGMGVMVLVNLVNIALSWALVCGVGPLPALGLAGIAIGTASGEVVGGLIVLALLARGRSGLSLRRAGLWPIRTDQRRLLRVSIPAAGESLTNTLGQLWFLGLINRLGDAATAAHGVAIRCESLAFLSVLAVSVPAGTLCGQYLGARRPDLARRAVGTAWALGAGGLAIVGVLLYSLARPMFHVFLGRSAPEVAALGVPVLQLVAFALPAYATIVVLSGALRGAGDTRWPWAFVLVGFLAVRIPLTYLLTATGPTGLGLGLYGAWIAMVADLAVRAGLVTGRFLSGGWTAARV